jgi:hypothetical protein
VPQTSAGVPTKEKYVSGVCVCVYVVHGGESRTHEPCSSLNVVGKGMLNEKLDGHGRRSESLRQSVIVSLQSIVVVVPPPATSSTLSKPSTFFSFHFLIIFKISN